MSKDNVNSNVNKQTITLDEVAKQFNDPERFKQDLSNLHVNFVKFILLYGDLGMMALTQAVQQEMDNL